SLDRSSPYGSWRWGGPEWTERIGEGAPGRLAGVTIAVAEPDEVAARWARVLDVPVEQGAEPALALHGAEVCFTHAAEEREEGLTEIALEMPAETLAAGEAIELGGVRLRALQALGSQ